MNNTLFKKISTSKNIYYTMNTYCWYSLVHKPHVNLKHNIYHTFETYIHLTQKVEYPSGIYTLHYTITNIDEYINNIKTCSNLQTF